MASIPYPPWSAPSTLEGQKKSKRQGNKKPWFRRSERKKKEAKQPEAHHSREESMEDRYNMNPFAPRQNQFGMGPGRGVPPFGSPFANHSPREPKPKKAEEPRGLFDPDALISKPARPSLANVFPIYNSPQITPVQTRTHVHERRHSVPASPPSRNVLSPEPEPRRPSYSSAASDIVTSERTKRRERRAHAIRQLPLLPNKHEREKQSVYNTPYRPPFVMGYPPLSPPYPPPVVMPMPHNFSFPPWPQPRQQLMELEEELEEEEEVDGGEDPYYHTVTEKSESPKKDSPKKAKATKKKSIEGKKLKKQPNESDEDIIKGFDSFMMY